MGRLTLNVLLSFAQFEREVIGERVRDKIAASKRKGLWVGGPVPLGYRSVGKKLESVPDDAALVRKIFGDYLRLGSIGELSVSLEKEVIRPRSRHLSNGKTIAARRFMVGPLAYLLKNRFYVGDVVYKGEVHKGEHEPILDRELFEAVQAQLAERKVWRKLARSNIAACLVQLAQGHIRAAQVSVAQVGAAQVGFTRRQDIHGGNRSRSPLRAANLQLL
jgi:site-specific DNA recombinase